MSLSIPELTPEQCEQVSAGHGDGLVMLILGFPHVLMGLYEFINFVAGRSIHGCSNIDDGDYVTEWACSYISPKAE